MKQKKPYGEMNWIGSPYKRVNLLCIIFTTILLINNFIRLLFIMNLPFLECCSHPEIWIVFPFWILLLAFQFFPIKMVIVKSSHIVIALAASLIELQSDFDSVYGLLFWLMAVILAYNYNFFNRFKLFKMIIICLFLFINVQASAYRVDRYMPGYLALLVFLFFLSIIYLAFKEELDKILRQEIRYKDENAKLINEKRELQSRIEEDRLHMAELEKYYKDYIESQKPFDLKRAGISSRNIELVRIFVTGNKSYKDVANEWELDPGTLRQRIYRINNKIGIDSLEELKQLCQFNWPESAGKY